jgi:hypothetical protein
MIGSLLLTSLSLAAAPAPALAPMGACAASKLWAGVLPAEMPVEQQRHLLHVQGKQIFWNGTKRSVERIVTELGPEMAQGSDMLVIDASTAKCGTVRELATALEGPAGCTPERCFVSTKTVPARKKPE